MEAAYEKLEVLGRGQFGEVFLVRRRADQRLFAAKVAHANTNVALATREAAILQGLRHPNIVRCVDTLVDNDQLTIIMECASGGDLDAYLKAYASRSVLSTFVTEICLGSSASLTHLCSQVPLSEIEIMRIFIQIALALDYMHERHILHRSMYKNILLDECGCVKVSDFGVSRILQSTVDVAETITGTPYYMSPELMSNEAYNAKSDVWSLGCILYELATFTPPFNGKALGAVVLQIVNESPVPLPDYYPQEMNQLVMQLLAKQPDRRPAVKEILAHRYVCQHMFKFLSVMSVEQSQILEGIGIVASDRRQSNQHQQIPPFIPAALNQPVAINRPPVSSAPNDYQKRQPMLQPDQVARQMFFENQAAAKKNRDRAHMERNAPPMFLGVTTEKPELKAAKKASAPNLNAHEIYLENARAAQRNKARALEELRRGEVPIEPSLAPVDGAPAAVPPAPPTTSQTSKPSFEEQLEAERRRIRQETKALHEKMLPPIKMSLLHSITISISTTMSGRRLIDAGKKIVAIGKNYEAHAREMGAKAAPREPVLFLKPTTSYVREGSSVLLPPGIGAVHHEVELGVVIGKGGRDIPERDSMDHVAGYVLAIDMTARALQDKAKSAGLPWTQAKGNDTFTPISEFIPKAKVPAPDDLTLWLKVGDELRQRGSTSDMVHKIPFLISYISRIMTLEEGDMIITGTPEGVGPVPANSTMTAGIDGLIEVSFPVETRKYST
ncbi:TPA: hypothetical protein N0F65_008668 [Lagenidium giganteum]|uniref:non-specific serine/threonine protein kinase n=1 Tax=Lagenidium giganteum TaxID=4803 RepID=A0AAV2Z8V5_9STRA|nr:TPA: hypothetical protein N0F65_008668 [Lagenidium giganteum]